MTGPRIKPMPNKVIANMGKFSNGKSAGQFGDAISRILTMARESDVMLFDRMEDEVFRILGVRYKLPEITL